MKDNVPPVSFGKIELSPEGGANGSYDRNYNFKIPQVGYWRGMLLKFQGSELGLGTQLIKDVYNSLLSASQYTIDYFSANGTLKTSYPKSILHALSKNTFSDVQSKAPHNQTIVPQGWVSPFDGNVRSGNYDPWESLWLRLNGGQSYGNQVTNGSYPNPTLVNAKGDARIAPYRHVPRCVALNAFGRNVHNLGNQNYDTGDVTANNKLKPGAGGYCTNVAVPGSSDSVVTAAATTNLLGYYSGTANVLVGSVDNTLAVNFSNSTVNVLKGSLSATDTVQYNPTAVNCPSGLISAAGSTGGVPFGGTAVTDVIRGTIDTGAVRSNSILDRGISLGLLGGIDTTNPVNFSNTLRGGVQYDTTPLPFTPYNISINPGAVMSNQTLYDGVPYRVTDVESGVPKGATIQNLKVPFGDVDHSAVISNIVKSNTYRNQLPYNCIDEGRLVFNAGGTYEQFADTSLTLRNGVPYDCKNTVTSPNPFYVPRWYTGYPGSYLAMKVPVDAEPMSSFCSYTDSHPTAITTKVNVPHSCSATTTWGIKGNGIGGLNSSGISLVTLYGGGSAIYNTISTTDYENSVRYGSVGNFYQAGIPRTGVPYGASEVGNMLTGGTARNNFPYNCSTVSAVVNYGAFRARVPYDCVQTSVIADNADKRTNVPYNCSNETIRSTGTLRTGVPYNVTVGSIPAGEFTSIPNVPYNVTTSTGTLAENLVTSSALDLSVVIGQDGCLFHQIPYYDHANQVSTFQPDGSYTNGSKGFAGTTPPSYNTNTQLRNRYLGQRLASTYDWCSQANLSKHLGALMPQQITISTHSRILQTIYPAETLARIYRMTHDDKVKWLSLIRPHITASPSSIQRGDTQTPGYNGGVNTTDVDWQREDSYTTYRKWTCYFPCFFTFFEDTSLNLDTRFIENIDVDVYVNPVYEIYDPSDLGIASSDLGTTLVIENSNDDRSKLVVYDGYNTQQFRQRLSIINKDDLTVTALCYFHNFHDSTNQSIRRMNYKQDIPANILGQNTFKESEVFLSANQVTCGGEISINLSCTNLVTEIIFMVRRRSKDVAAHPQLEMFPFENMMTTLPIESVSLTASGQLIYQATGVECLLADQWDFNLSSIHAGKNTSNNTSLYADSHESYYSQSKPRCDGFFAYRIPFSFSQDRTYNSGSVSFSSLNNPILTIKLLPLHGWVIQDDNLAFERGSLFNLSENMNQRECDTQTVFDNDFQIEIYENYFQLHRIDSNTGTISKTLDM